MDIANNASTNEYVLDRAQVRVFDLFNHSDIVQLDVQVLIHALEGTANGDIVLKLYCDFAVDERFEEAIERIVLA